MNIYKCNCSAEVDGQTLDVIEAKISLAINSIPTIILLCSPRTGGGSGVNVMKSTPKELAVAYEKLDPTGLEQEGNVSIEAIPAKQNNQAESPFSLTLKGWKLSGAGLSACSPNGIPLLSVCLQHPICELTTCGPIYGLPNCDIGTELDKETSKASGIIGVLQAVYSFCRNKALYQEITGNGASILEAYRDKLGDGSILGKYLKEEIGGSFLGMNPYSMSKAIGRFAIPRENSGSIFDCLLDLCGMLMINITQNSKCNFMNTQLIIEPIDPWKEASQTISTETTYEIEFPGVDPCPLAAVTARLYSENVQVISLGMVGTSVQTVQDSVHAYADQKKSNPNGKVLCISAPWLLTCASTRTSQNGESIQTLQTELLDDVKSNFNNPMKKYCKAVYGTSYRALTKARVSTELNKNLFPGEVCRVEAGGFIGRIYQVDHIISMRPGVKSETVVYLSHVGTSDQRLSPGNAAWSN